MFSQRSCYFSQLSRSHPILKLIDIYDRQSFIRVYVLDNVYMCILMYILFYVAVWYANNIIKRIERSNREMSTTVAENKTKLDRLVLLKKKKAEFEETIVKTTDAQKVTTKHLEDEMHRLSTELITTSNKITGLEKVVEKMVFSTNTRTNYLAQPTLSGMNVRKSSKGSRVRSRSSRFSNRHFHHLYHRNHRLGNMESLSVDRLGGERRLQLHLRLRCQKSDSNNSASAEASSESVNQYPTNKLLSRYNYHDGDRKRHPKWLYTKTHSRRSSCCNMCKIQMASLKNVTPFTKSLLGLATIFLRGYP
ncbi:PREDICTED: uncharacterized protein LOC108779461 isoform X1 [Cyphomyrmex costatus]|uniref:Uncharacterized protein n=1 Tax=Cyphomyrmex costatus TaxID=456900 RepID=A0A195C716_9HYME|nr:PREDICTED: uncharacterized protein LOC108779461 isoform X1 [Cyphomyrmex costatus]KYM96430.1 hypothetical protein ALC62_12936 [Cyphomyrmex costatus]